MLPLNRLPYYPLIQYSQPLALSTSHLLTLSPYHLVAISTSQNKILLIHFLTLSPSRPSKLQPTVSGKVDTSKSALLLWAIDTGRVNN
jgi:hypothetical protein